MVDGRNIPYVQMRYIEFLVISPQKMLINIVHK